jgi:sortase B
MSLSDVWWGEELKKTLRSILMLASLAIFVFSAAQVWRILRGYEQAERQYAELEQYVADEPPVVQPEPTAPPTQPEEETEISAAPAVDFEALSQINDDIVGWLIVEGTQINYPVVQGSDNKYYLNHRFDKGYNSAGCLFLDAGNDPGLNDRNSIVYGHYMKNGSMFAGISEYKDEAFYRAHPSAWFITPDGAYTVDFFSGYVSDVGASAWDREFSADGYGEWLEELKAKSCFSSDITPGIQDRVVTLSTCSYEFQNARFVLHGVAAKFGG